MPHFAINQTNVFLFTLFGIIVWYCAVAWAYFYSITHLHIYLQFFMSRTNHDTR